MNWRTPWIAGLAMAIVACGSGEDEGEEQTGAQTPANQPAAQPPATEPGDPADTGASAPVTEAPPPTPALAERPAASMASAMDEPYTPTHTGNVSPGMSRDEVVGVWGPPVAERSSAVWTYLYFRNGCEVSCGTFDVVFLENGQVVDAIVRGPGHTYEGTSSSPPGREARMTPPGSAGGSSD
jgi:hypothetical protein